MAGRTYISFDWAIKKLLRQKANFVVLEGFISTVIEKEIKIVELLESESNKERANEKSSRVDILAKDKNDTKYIIEVQYESEVAYFQRILFETSKYLKEYLKAGENYLDVKKIYSINVVYFDMGRGKDYVYIGKTEFRGKKYHDLLELSPFQQEKLGVKYPSDLYPEYIVLKINDFNEKAVTPIEQWMEFLKTSTISDNATAPGLPEARERMKLEFMSPEEKRAYEKHQMDLAILRDQMYTARGEGEMVGHQKGKAEGIEEGRYLEKIDIAKNLKAQGLPIALIASGTGLTEEQIEKL